MPEPVERDQDWLVSQVAAALVGEISDSAVRAFYGLLPEEPIEPLHRERMVLKKARAAVDAIVGGVKNSWYQMDGAVIAGFASFFASVRSDNWQAGKPMGSLCAAGITLGPLKPHWLTSKEEEARAWAGSYAGESIGPEVDPAGFGPFVGNIGGVYYQSPSIGPNNENSAAGWFNVKKPVGVEYRSRVGADDWQAWTVVETVRGVLAWGHLENRGANQDWLVLEPVHQPPAGIFGMGLGVGNLFLFKDRWNDFAEMKTGAAQAWANPLAAGFPVSQVLKCFPRKTAWARRMPPDGSLRSEPVQWLTFGEFMDRWERWRDVDIVEGRMWPEWPGDREVSRWRVRCVFAPEFVASVVEAGATGL